jgi:hypothetical protein
MFSAAIAAEREACAKISINMGDRQDYFLGLPRVKWVVAADVAKSIAAAIRARNP